MEPQRSEAGYQVASVPPLGHGNFPYLCGNLSDVVVSPLLYTCYQNSQSISRAYEQYGASTIQPISEEMQLLLTVYYLVQLGEPCSCHPGMVAREESSGPDAHLAYPKDPVQLEMKYGDVLTAPGGQRGVTVAVTTQRGGRELEKWAPKPVTCCQEKRPSALVRDSVLV